MQVVRVILIVSSTAAVTLKIDPSVVLATRQYVDDQIIQVKAYVDQQLAAHVAAADPHTQYLLESDIDKYIPVGFPLPWPQATPPGGWLKCNGATFDKAKYPKLAAAYPSGALPDLRGEFLRGWDDGRGVDSGRALLTAQDATGITDYHGDGNVEGATNAPARNYYRSADSVVSAGTGFTAFGVANGGSTTIRANGITSYINVRPRNVSFSYIVRAA